MLDCNSPTLAVTDLQLWVLGRGFISDVPIGGQMKAVYDQILLKVVYI